MLVFIILDVLEANDSSQKYNKTELVATNYTVKNIECDSLQWRAFVVAEYDAFSNKTLQHYQQTFDKVNHQIICGINREGALYNASKVWPLSTSKKSYYLISDPTTLVRIVTHGEIYLILAILCFTLCICGLTCTALYLWSRRQRKVIYMAFPLQI